MVAAPRAVSLRKMMEEVFTMMAYDAQFMEQMSEQEILACLGDETGPTITVLTKKAELREGRLQIMDDEEISLDKYLKENHRLQEASLRLEQENDNLAHRLISSKVALRNALDKAEDKVDELTKELLQTRHQLQATEEEKRGKEEETAMLKEIFRRELEKTEQEVKRSTVIIADYKQICSQMTNRLERQQAAYREELDSLKNAVKACARCQHTVDTDESSILGQDSSTAALTESHRMTEQSQDEDNQGHDQAEQKKEDKEREYIRAQIRELEQELAQTKLQLVEADCKIQELEHQKRDLANDLNEAKNSWISKAFTSLRTNKGIHGLGVPSNSTPAVGWNLHSGSLSGWKAMKLSWPHRDNRENI